MFFRACSCERKEPVRIVGGASAHRPDFHSVGYIVGNGGVERYALAYRVEEFFVYRLGNVIFERF